MASGDVFGRKRLAVLNKVPTVDPTAFVLEDDGLRCDETVEKGELERRIIAALRTVHDPEIPLNIYDLGLVYRVELSDESRVEVDMTLTSPGCPVAAVLVRQVHEAVRKVPGVASVRTQIVWDPPWTRERMGEAARLALGLM